MFNFTLQIFLTAALLSVVVTYTILSNQFAALYISDVVHFPTRCVQESPHTSNVEHIFMQHRLSEYPIYTNHKLNHTVYHKLQTSTQHFKINQYRTTHKQITDVSNRCQPKKPLFSHKHAKYKLLQCFSVYALFSIQ